ncbi:MAG: hypothetical protein FRX49_08607 [Trebouxia sp. A1-2]|nr:MAG: hypothetical protein FRX49_08607 [Trebouxia sp. A1-2]
MESLLWGCVKSAEACEEGREGRRVMTWLSALLSTESFQMTVSDTRASATLGVQLGVKIRGVAYEDLHQGGCAGHILLCWPEGAGTGACCLGPVLAGLGASGLMETGGDFCNTIVHCDYQSHEPAGMLLSCDLPVYGGKGCLQAASISQQPLDLRIFGLQCWLPGLHVCYETSSSQPQDRAPARSNHRLGQKMV